MTAPTYTIGPRSLRIVCPRLSETDAHLLAQDLGEAMHRFGITEPHACAHFVAQCAHESGQFEYTRELWGPTRAQRAYGWRLDLQGRGRLGARIGLVYRGAGWIQTTGRRNFRAAAKALHMPLDRLVARAGERRVASLLAAVWWARSMPHDLTGWTCEQVTRRVNGGTNGLAQREAYTARAMPVRMFLTPRPSEA